MPRLTTADQVKAYLLGIAEEPPAGHVSLLEFFIDAQSGAVEDYCHRRFAKQTYSAERYHGIDGKEVRDVSLYSGYAVRGKVLRLRQWPVVSVTSVSITEGGVAVTVVEGTADANWQKARDAAGDWVGLYREDGWRSDPLGISVTHDAGYVLPAVDVTGRNLPFPIERAVVELVADDYQHRGKSGVSSESFEGLSLQFDRWPLRIKDLLRPYRRPDS